ncbi:class I SAM-dependent methyltransferase [Roseovarius aestuariivivens]|uniref:class I SAM-dependent methyltransferase n=1 Tax=Roseovarius aestuariivivens TaxID=1888910 RepID=UPI001FDA805A|nr:class I SAM-dependent methyltransferase [Roseovarius aestuariivivens]
MSETSRLSLAVGNGELPLPEAGRIAVFGPAAGMDLSTLPQALCHIITGFRPDYDHFASLGFACATAPEGRYGASLVCAARAKPLSFARIAEAAAVTDGPVIVDGLKTDGIESLLKACRKRTEVPAPLSKSHGKLFWFPASDTFSDWVQDEMHEIEGGFVTSPGVFSADAVDPASRLLADHLPEKLGARVADLGAGWGYLSARVLKRESVAHLDLVEADHAALTCARRNVPDSRAAFHWEDALRWRPATQVDCVVMNPPFHTGRKGDPDLGRSFIRAGADILAPSGQLWLVANRHLPYEAELAAAFGEVSEAGGDARFKILHATRPSRKRR